VVGPFSRSLDDLHHLVAHTLDVNKKTTTFPTRILYPLDFFPHSNPKHQAMVDEFISVLENFLGTKRHELSIAERWAQCPPNGLENQPLKKYLANINVEALASKLHPKNTIRTWMSRRYSENGSMIMSSPQTQNLDPMQSWSRHTKAPIPSIVILRMSKNFFRSDFYISLVLMC